MLSTVWRLAEKDFGIDEFLSRFDLQNNAVISRQGDKRHNGKIRDKSGFNIIVSENLDSTEHIHEIGEFIIKHQSAFEWLAKEKISSVFDIGCTVGTEQFTKTIYVPSNLLGTLSLLSVSLEFSAYPASDEENET